VNRTGSTARAFVFAQKKSHCRRGFPSGEPNFQELQMSRSNDRAERESLSVKSSQRKVFSGARVARAAIAAGGLLAIAACQDVTAPEKPEVSPAIRMSNAPGDVLGTLSSNLDDMTSWSLVALPDGTGKTNIVGLLNGLKGHLKSGQVAACQQDITDARAFLGSLSDVQQVEVGQVGVALDVIKLALDSIK